MVTSSKKYLLLLKEIIRMSFSKSIKNGSFWNIGFCYYTPEKLMDKKELPNIQWMRHPYKDRFFADPFILKITD